MNSTKKRHQPTKKTRLAERIRQREQQISQTPLPVKIDDRMLRMGVNLQTGGEVLISPQRFDHNPHVLLLGAPGTGKTTLILQMLSHLLRLIRNYGGAVIVMNPKGSFGRKFRDMVIAQGMADRLEIFDPSVREWILSYNPLHPNSLYWAIHAKQLREEIRAATGQTSLDQTQQLARILFIILATARLLEFTLAEAVKLLRPGSDLRKAVIPKVSDPYLRDALEYIDSLPISRQEELCASSLARLEQFILDPTIRHIVAQQRPSLDMGDIINNHKILLCDIREYDPLRSDDARLLGRFIVNDIITHVFSRKGPATPVYLVMDEAYTFNTEDLCRSLDRGRELGLRVILAAQFLNQFNLPDGNTILRDSVMKSIETRMVFRMADTNDCRDLSRQLFFDQYNPWQVKDEITSLELEPIEETRISRSQSHSHSRGRGLAFPQSVAEGESESETYSKSSGESFGEHEEWGESKTQGHADTVAAGVAHTEVDGTAHTDMNSVSHMVGHGQSHGQMNAHGTGVSAAESLGVTVGGDLSAPLMMTPEILTTSTQELTSSSINDVSASSHNASEFEAIGVSHAEADTVSHAEANSLSLSKAKTVSESEGETESQGVSLTHSRENSESTTEGRNRTVTRGITPSVSEEEGWSESETIQPFITHTKRRVPTARTFLSEEEFVTLRAQAIHKLPKGHYVLQVPAYQAIFVRAHFFQDLQLTEEEREEALKYIYSRPSYGQVKEIEAEECERIKQLAEATSSTLVRQVEEGKKIGPTNFRHRITNKSRKGESPAPPLS